MYEIEYTQVALDDLKWFRKHEQKTIVQTIDTQLKYEPTVQTRNRKPMRPNLVGEWELRVGQFRVLYDVAETVRIVEIERIGQKRGNKFFFQGKEEDL
ncbi:MAG: type II toxin-antitoxin system RelE/ParE family toxin [Deltaproteobacteria bacterium]|nr:type II toxin-antitoxin system RelE/ParE family toxin [Deltaproteobacteria bacterium]